LNDADVVDEPKTNGAAAAGFVSVAVDDPGIAKPKDGVEVGADDELVVVAEAPN
jgi:hypothetical protein